MNKSTLMTPVANMNRLRRAGILPALLLPLLFTASPTFGADADAVPPQTTEARVFDIDIPSQDLADALNTLSRTSRSQISASSATLEGRTSNAVNGAYTVLDAIRLMTNGSGLVTSRTGANSYTLSHPETGSAQLPFEEILVTGSYTRRSANSATGLNMTLRETPQSVTVMSHERMEDQNLTEISEVLTQAVGLTYDGSALGSDGSYFFARGFQVSNYQVNGIPRPDGIYGFQETTSDMTAYDRIEIVRGATGLMNGVGNPSASINLIRKKPSDSLSGNLSLQSGSWDRTRIGAEIGGPLTANGRIRGLLAASHHQSDSYIDRIHLEKKAAYGVIEGDVSDNTTLSLGMEYQSLRNLEAPRGGLPLFYSDGSTTDFPRSSNPSAHWGDLSNSSTNLFASLEHTLGSGWLLKLIAEHAEPEYDEIMGYIGSSNFDPETGVGASLSSARWAGDLEQDFAGAYLQGQFHWLDREHELVFGLTHSSSSDNGPSYCGWWCGGAYSQPIGDANAFLRDGRSGVVEPDLSASSSRYGGTIRQDSFYSAIRLKPLESLALILGARMTDWKETEWSQATGGAKSYSPPNEEEHVITPYAGLVLDINRNMSLYGSVTQIFEPQNRNDINGDKLDPLEGTNYEAGLKTEFFNGAVSASVGVFRIEEDNLAIYVAGVFSPDGGYVYRSEDGTVSTGFELEIAGEPLPGWQIVGGYSKSDPRDINDSPLLTEVPRENLKLFSSYAFDRSLPGLTLGGNLRWQGKSYTNGGAPNGETYTQHGLVLADLFAKYALNENLFLQLNVNNLFDKKYYSGIGWTANYGEPRNFAASVRWTF